MLRILRSFIFTSILFIFVKGLIPSLTVQKIDRKLIAQKRQDTLDMCRIFTTENNRIEQSNDKPKGYVPYYEGLRAKRDTGNMKLGAAPISEESVKRIENIVGKLYEDLEENGEKVTYMTRMPTVKNETNKTMRRFNFAPAELLGPSSNPHPNPVLPEEDTDTTPSNIPWAKRWKYGIVPYFIDSKTYDSQLAETIVKAFDYFERATCIRLQKLRDRPTDKQSLQNVEWLYISNPTGIRQCVHSNEKKANQGVQMVVFGYDCLSLGEIVHEVMHVLGFSHEHTRPDRDQYVTILWNNIKPGYKKYFELRTEDQLLSIPYDYTSVLHYPSRAFSKNGQITIMSQDNAKLGQREGLSETDIEKIGLIYGSECVDRNKKYLLTTCPSVVKPIKQSKNISQEEISSYFKGKLWQYGLVNYKLKDGMEFSIEEKENIKAVIAHIEKETCIRFRDISEIDEEENNDNKAEIVERKDHIILDEQNNVGVVNDKLTSQVESENEIKTNDEDNTIESSKDQTSNGNIGNGGTQSEVTQHKTTNDTKGGDGSRRHAGSILVFTRSPEPGCACPTSGKPDGNKILKINGDCFNSVNDLLHLFVHLLGLDHQHNMHDRDAFLHILWDKITPEIRNEMKNKLPPAASLGFDYDYQSVMHYPWLQIKNGVTNLMYPIWNDGWAMGHWQGLSSIDVQKLNVLYSEECAERQKEIGSEKRI